MMNDDMELVRAYAVRQSEAAFETLVTRHVNLVYSSALRQTRDPHLAEEITQAVFIILARKANSLNEKTILPSWLHRTAGFAAADALKIQRRRAQREQEAFMQSTLNEPEKETWQQIAPLLDAAIAGLNEKDRHAVVLRFFQNKSMDEIGAALGASEDAAKMRVNRALEKLRQFFVKRGIASTAATLAGAISANSVQAAPAGLAKTISAIAISKGAVAGGSTLTLAKGALKLMAWTKTKTAIVTGVVVLLAAGSAMVVIHNWGNELYHQKQPSDAMVRQKLPGTWTETGADGVIKTITIDSGGHTTMKISGRSSGSSEGTTQVKNGFLIATITKSSQRIHLPFTQSARIIRMDDRELVVQGGQNSQVVYKKVEP